MIDHLHVAEAQLRGRPRQAAVALVSVGVGSAMLIVTLSLTSGLSEDFIKKTTETSSHVEILPRRPQSWKPEVLARAGELVDLSRHHIPDEKRVIRGLAGVMRSLGAIRGVRVVAPAVEAQVVLSYGTIRRSAVLQAVTPGLERAVSLIADRIIRGRWADFEATPNGVVLGSGLARALGVDVGGHLQAQGPSGGALPLRIVAIATTGLSRIDKTLALVNLPLGQAIAQLSTDQATTVRLALDDPLRAPEVATIAEALTGYVARSWQERSSASVEAFERQNRITLVLVFFTTLVAAFGVANVLVQLVSDKRRDIAIMRAAGFARHDIGIIFLHEGVLLGLLGSVLGWAVGAIGIRVVAALPVDFGESAAMRNEHLQMAEHPSFYLWALVVSVVICALAAVGPARRAAALEPTAILRGER